MKIEKTIERADELARKAAAAIWAALPEERRKPGEIENELARLLLRAGAALATDWAAFETEARRQLTARENRYARLRDTYPNAGKAWSPDDDTELRRLFQCGTSPRELSSSFGRSVKAIEMRLERLGLVAPQQAAA